MGLRAIPRISSNGCMCCSMVEHRLRREMGSGRAAVRQGWEAYCQVLLCANEFIMVD